mmetsp:Transcript_9604/g.29955  ORF Transcript_9604/g.29955 Transcript_9604/m.29955 type:complete len:231 (+) Transcript_9604:1977-2669(+)
MRFAAFCHSFGNMGSSSMPSLPISCRSLNSLIFSVAQFMRPWMAGVFTRTSWCSPSRVSWLSQQLSAMAFFPVAVNWCERLSARRMTVVPGSTETSTAGASSCLKGCNCNLPPEGPRKRMTISGPLTNCCSHFWHSNSVRGENSSSSSREPKLCNRPKLRLSILTPRSSPRGTSKRATLLRAWSAVARPGPSLASCSSGSPSSSQIMDEPSSPRRASGSSSGHDWKRPLS